MKNYNDLEDVSLQTLLEAKRLVAENVLSAVEETRTMALDIQNQLDGQIRFGFFILINRTKCAYLSKVTFF